MDERNVVERFREGLETAHRNYENPGDSFFWPDDPNAQADMIHWLSGIVHEPRWPIEGREAAYGLLQRLADEAGELHPTSRRALEAAAVEALASGPPKLAGRPSAAWRDKAIVEMYRSLRRQDCPRPQAVALLSQAVKLDKSQVRNIIRAGSPK